MGFLDISTSLVLTHPFVAFLLAPLGLVSILSIYRLYFHPLSSVPGPWYCAILPGFNHYHAYRGTECSAKHRLHSTYGPIIRTGPNEIDIADGAALSPIYSEKGGFRKAPCYRNFDIDGHPSIFSELDPSKRAIRSKAVMSMFSANAIRSGQNIIAKCVDRWVERLKAAKKESATQGKSVELLNLTRSLAADTITSYLYDENYDGLGETGELSATGMVDSFVAVGRFFYLPTPLFNAVMRAIDLVAPSADEQASLQHVDVFVSKVLSNRENTKEEKDTYQARLRAANLSASEVHAQCKDLLFAGIDSTGTNLATILWHLANRPDILAKLRAEILQNKHVTDPVDMQALPYLRGVIREGLRLSLANPSRLPRLAPPGGWSFGGYYFPAGTVVACAPYEMHLNPAVFARPLAFVPERWEAPSEEMVRNHIPFGLGSRQCIARNLASAELFLAVKRCVEDDVLARARGLGKIELLEWFNSSVKGGKIEIIWDRENEELDRESV